MPVILSEFDDLDEMLLDGLAGQVRRDLTTDLVPRNGDALLRAGVVYVE